MTRVRFVLVALALLAASTVSAQTSITGAWDVTITGPQGPNTSRVEFKQDGDKVTGVFKSPNGELPFDKGTLTGNDLKFSFTVQFQGTPLEIVLTGKVAGDKMVDGKADFGGFVEGTWDAKRAGDAAPATTTTSTATTAATTTSTASTTTAKAGGAAGTWDVTFKTPQGDMPATAVLTEEAGAVKGTFTSQVGEVPVSGTFAGKALKLEMKAQTPQGEMNIAMTAELEGDTFVKGTAEIAGMGQFEWSAKRKQ